MGPVPFDASSASKAKVDEGPSNTPCAEQAKVMARNPQASKMGAVASDASKEKVDARPANLFVAKSLRNTVYGPMAMKASED